MKTTRNLLIAVLVLFGTIQLNAQHWNLNGNDIYNNNSGNVGIGTSTPTSDLNIDDENDVSNLVIQSPLPSTAANRVIGNLDILNSTTNDLFRLVLRLKNGNHEMVQSAFSTSRNAWIPYVYLNYTTGKYEMRTGVTDAEFKNTGNILFNNTGAFGVGMGTTAIPSGVKMAVNGKINCKEVEVTLSGWSDYVFAKDYNLRTLEEVEAYIKENKHLPDVPSEKEVLENGVNVGEMNSTLLRKIEELTLYMIELKKENEQMKAQIKKLME